MAWRSSGTNNDEMVDNLKRFGVIHSQAIEDGFRAVDRRFFVPQNRQEAAHSDQPLKERNVHISAPHIYGSALEALELVSNSSLSFLNLGSGTGYLSCIVAEILGPSSSNYGVEIYEDVVRHSLAAIAAWKAERSCKVAHIEVVHGNALQIDYGTGECLFGFDRIYIGASIEKRNLPKLAGLLRPGGILVGPVDDELVKVVRVAGGRPFEDTQQSNPSPRVTSLHSSLPDDFTLQVLSGVRFAPLVQSPEISTVIRSRVWNPSIHQCYPNSFRKSIKELIMCAHAAPEQPYPQGQEHNQTIQKHSINTASMLPRAIWMEVLSYTHRNWFEPRPSEEDLLRQRLKEEQAAVTQAQQARLEAEARLHMAEQERDVYRHLALRWQYRLQTVMNEQRSSNNADSNQNQDNRHELDNDAMLLDDITQVASIVFANEPVMLRLGGLGAMIRRFQQSRDEGGNDNDDDDDDNNMEQHFSDTEDDEDSEMEEDVATMAEDVPIENDEAATTSSSDAIDMSVSHISADLSSEKARTVSITSTDDL